MALARFKVNPLALPETTTVREVYERWSAKHFEGKKDGTIKKYRAAFNLLVPIWEKPFANIYLDEWQTGLETDMKKEGYYIRPRFSPGYGDFDIAHQDMILRMLDAAKKIGLTLTGGNMLTPSKSVTAVIGLSETETSCHIKGCEVCQKKDCAYRRS